MGEGGEGGEGGNHYHHHHQEKRSDRSVRSEQACSLIYVTCPSADEARKIGRALVEQRMAACANVMPGMESCYRWQGKVEQAEEAVLIVKTRKEKAAWVVDRVRELHSYSVPCVVELPVLSGNPAYIDWIHAETA